MTKTSLPEDNFEIDLDKFESNGMRLMGKSHDPLTSADDLFPKKDNITAEELRNTVVIGFANWDDYARGYKDAAEVLIERIEKVTRHDELVYPVMFLYRHYLELTIKKLMIKMRVYDQKLILPKDFYHEHRLNILWKKCE